MSALATALFLPLLAGCPGRLEGDFLSTGGTGGSSIGVGGMPGTGGGSATSCDAPGEVFAVGTGKGNCSIGGCHGRNSFMPDLTDADPWPALQNKNATSGLISPTCVGMPYVTPGNPPGGVLMMRVMGEGCGVGTKMPSGFDPLTATQIDCLARWLISKL